MAKILLAKKQRQAITGKQEKLIDPLNGNLFKSIIAFSVPVILSGVLQLAFNAADMIIVGQAKGSDPVGQVGSTSSLISLIVNLFIGLSVGVNVNVAREYGAKNMDEVSKYVHTSVVTAIIGGVICAIIGFFGAELFLSLMGTPEGLLDGAALYMKIYFLAMPASMVYNFCSAVCRGLGNPKTPLTILICAGIINVIFNLIFVLGFQMSVEGVAIATVISQYFSMVCILIYLSKVDGPHRIYRDKIRIDKKCLRSILAIGLPAGFTSSVFSISNVIVQSSVNSFDSVAIVSGNSAASSIEGFIYTAQNAFAQTAVTFVGQNKGAAKFKRILSVVGICTLYSIGVDILLSLLVYVLREPLLALYLGDSSDAFAAGALRISIVVLTHFLCALMDLFVGASRGLGASISPMILSICIVCGVRILWLLTVFPSHRVLEMIYVAYPISWAMCALCQGILFFAMYRSIWKKQKNNQDSTMI